MLTEIKYLDVYLLYSPKDNKEYSFFEIVNEEMPLDFKDYEASNFWGINGGFEIVVNGYCSIFRSTDFHYLVKATSFLIHSLYWIEGIKNDWFDIDEDYPKDVVVRTTNSELLILSEISEGEVSLSYTSSELSYRKARGRRYFENIIIDKSDWRDATVQALGEYFEILLKVIQNSTDDVANKTMMSYYNVWRNINKG